MKLHLLLVTSCLLAADPAVTVYNRDFGVVRETVPLDLQTGTNRVRFSGAAAHLEPDSVILRDPSGRLALRILEQNFFSDPISPGLMLALFEGKTLDFEQVDPITHVKSTIRGKVLRSGYVRHQQGIRRYGASYDQRQYNLSYGSQAQPVVEVAGRLYFSLPGTPMFPPLPTDAILKPTLDWLIDSGAPARLEAELSYVTGGMSWQADYNIVAPEQGDMLDLTGWVTIDNQSGKSYPNARIKLVAGDVSKVQRNAEGMMLAAKREYRAEDSARPAIQQRSFDEYHLYTLERATTLEDRETKQVEFLKAKGIRSRRIYIYDGFLLTERYRNWDPGSIRDNAEYGTTSNPKVWVYREIDNTQKNQLGIPLPAGRARFYRRDRDGQLEFTGEDMIDHTPHDEKLRVYIGNAFDLVGERKRTSFTRANNTATEAFEIKVRNRKQEAVEIVVVERLYRWLNWSVTQKSAEFRKKDSQTIEFPVLLQPNEERTVTYTVHYSW
jgi:hypothetical protein